MSYIIALMYDLETCCCICCLETVTRTQANLQKQLENNFI